MPCLKTCAVALLACCATSVHGSITLQFSDFSNSLNMLADSSNTGPTNGLLWGILIDTQGKGFSALTSSIDADVTLVDGAELAPGLLFFAGGTTVTSLGADGGAGAVATTNGLDPYSFPNVATGQAFAIVWFDNGVIAGSTLPFGSLYGILTNAGLTLPADGTGTSSFAALFDGTDPVRPTDQTLTASLPDETSSSVVTVDPGGGDPTTRNLAFEFPVSVFNDNSGALSYILEQSTTLTAESWTTLTTTTEVVSDNGSIRVLRLVDPDPVGTDPRRFLRLRISP